MNANNERFNRTIQEQLVDYNDDLLFSYMDLFDQKMGDWLIGYNAEISHYSLKMKTPVQYLIETNLSDTCYGLIRLFDKKY